MPRPVATPGKFAHGEYPIAVDCEHGLVRQTGATVTTKGAKLRRLVVPLTTAIPVLRKETYMKKLVASAMLAGSLWAGEFWNDKEPAQWSEKEVERILTKSPWAKQVTAAMDFAKLRDRPGGMGGPGLGGGPLGGIPEFIATVRWESAEPVRAALKKTAADAEKTHVVSISGLPMMGRGRNEEIAARRKELLEKIKDATTLTGKSKTGLNPSRIHVDESTGAIYFFFEKSESISGEAKDLTFTTQMGPLEFKAKFSPQEMMYKGQAAL
jgi:hypothetical protein